MIRNKRACVHRPKGQLLIIKKIIVNWLRSITEIQANSALSKNIMLFFIVKYFANKRP